MLNILLDKQNETDLDDLSIIVGLFGIVIGTT